VEEFLVFFSGGKLQVEASYNQVNTGGSSENFWFLPAFPVCWRRKACFEGWIYQNPEYKFG
jgi:hypothetical protein